MFADDGIKLMSSVFGKRSKTVNKGQRYVLYSFLDGINAWNKSKGASRLSATFGKFASTSVEAERQAILKEWNGEVPAIACAWKQNKRAKKAMLRKGTSTRALSDFRRPEWGVGMLSAMRCLLVMRQAIP